jgi:hypothetical protein
MEATRYSETSVDFHGTARQYIPEDKSLEEYLCYEFERSGEEAIIFRISPGGS